MTLAPRAVATPAAAAGLTSDAVRERRARHGPNALPAAARPTLLARGGRELREPMALLLLGAAVVAGVLLGDVVEAVAILVIVLVNAVIALVQEGRAERAMAALEELEAPSATVVRDGRRQRVDARGLVPDDLVLVQAGDRVPADLVVVEADALEVDEAVLTGESLPVGKHAGGRTDAAVSLGDRDGALFSGTLVTRGAGRGVVAAIGAGTALGGIAAGLDHGRREPTPIQRQLAGLTSRLGVAAVVVAGGAFLLTVGVVNTLGMEEAFLTSVALAVAAVPEGMAAVTTVALSLGVGRMARRGAIVRRLPAVETLGAADVLVIDKTGTVTENRMRASEVVDPAGRTVPAHGWRQALAPEAAAVLLLCSDATLDPPTGDPTERALLDLVADRDVEARPEAAPRLASAPFTSDRRRMATVHALDGSVRLLLKGAPEAVLPRCTRARGPASDLPLGPPARAALEEAVARAAGRGGRVLALATRILATPPAGPDEVEAAEDGLDLLGFVVLRDPPRPSAAASVRAVREAGLRLLMATGDHPATAVAIAREVGIDGRAVVTGADARVVGLPDDPDEVTVLARVDPDQKLELVRRLQRRGHVVAMTGDGVNDAPALRHADIGVALGATGSDVAREAADVVVTDDDLATIVAAIHEGRTIHDNLRKVVDYLVASNLSEVVVVATTLLAVPALGVPLFPLQLLWINLMTDGLPALALGVDPAHPGVMRRPPRDPAERLLDGRHLRRLAWRGGALAAGAVGALLVAHHLVGLTSAASRTVLFSALVVAQAVYAWVVRRPAGTHERLRPNRWLAGATVGSLVLQALVVTVAPLGRVLGTVPLGPLGWALVIAGGLLGPLAIALAGRARPTRATGLLLVAVYLAVIPLLVAAA